jgi:predicted NBD/HSP70 family sugar kinase
MIGGVLAGLVNFYNPEAIFIGGGVSNIGHQFLSTIRRSTLKRATALSTRSLRIDYSELGADAGVHGAIWLAMENIFSPVAG